MPEKTATLNRRSGGRTKKVPRRLARIVLLISLAQSIAASPPAEQPLTRTSVAADIPRFLVSRSSAAVTMALPSEVTANRVLLPFSHTDARAGFPMTAPPEKDAPSQYRNMTTLNPASWAPVAVFCSSAQPIGLRLTFEATTSAGCERLDPCGATERAMKSPLESDQPPPCQGAHGYVMQGVWTTRFSRLSPRRRAASRSS
eukprot:5537737-Prymnesium_polylepis.1